MTAAWPREGTAESHLVRKSLLVFAVHAVLLYRKQIWRKGDHGFFKKIVQIVPFIEDLTLRLVGLRFA